MVVDAHEAPALRAGKVDIDLDLVLEQHQHPQHLLAWSETATVAIRAASDDWLLPPTHALWIPSNTPHAVTALRPGAGYAIEFQGAHRAVAATEPTGIRVTALIRELIIHLDGNPEHNQTRRRAEALLLDLFEPAPSGTFQVPLPTDPRIRMIADALLAEPADPRDLVAWAHTTNTGVRTVTRLFARETGMSFAQWRTHVRVRAAITHLARGTAVGATARAVGYRKPAAFAEAFRRVTGQRPGELARRGEEFEV